MNPQSPARPLANGYAVHHLERKPSLLFVCFMALTLASCSNEASLLEKYDQLCQIYENTNSLGIDREGKRLEIIDRVDTQLPEFFDEQFDDILLAEPSRRYKFIQQMVESETGNSDWECPAIQTYYDNY